MFFIIVREMRGLLRPYGFLSSRASVGGSVARASDAKVSMIKLTHSIWTAFSGESWRDTKFTHTLIISHVVGIQRINWRDSTRLHCMWKRNYFAICSIIECMFMS